MNITKRYQKKGGKTFRKISKKTSRKTKRKHARLTKKDRREGGILGELTPVIRKVATAGPVRRVASDIAEEYAKGLLKDELLHKKTSISNRFSTPTRQLSEKIYVPESQVSIPNMKNTNIKYPNYNDENQENINPNFMRNIQNQLAEVHKPEQEVL